MKFPKEILWVLGLLYLQQVGGISEWGIDLPLIYVILAGLRTTAPKAAGWGFVMGLAEDLLSAGWFGVHTIAKTLTGILSSLSQRHVYREKILTQTFLIFIMSSFHQLFVWGILKWDGSAPPFADALGIVGRTVFMTMIAGSGVSYIVVRFRRRKQDPATA